ncbi:MAG: hypothetical protein K2L84_04090, partial [Muribaculaceae bacterium]|nr:hypothetical protein [Muribaculaceae bacterium]
IHRFSQKVHKVSQQNRTTSKKNFHSPQKIFPTPRKKASPHSKNGPDTTSDPVKKYQVFVI